MFGPLTIRFLVPVPDVYIFKNVINMFVKCNEENNNNNKPFYFHAPYIEFKLI